jgi:hypothetical protein
MRIVYPIPVEKWIVKVAADGIRLSRRRSPKVGKPTDVFAELVRLPEYLVHPRLEVDVLLTVEEEYRRPEPGQAWRTRGWVVVDRQLIKVLDSILLNDREDLTGLMPAGLPNTSTTADLAEKMGRPRRHARQMAYCLRKAGVFVAVDKRGNYVEYRMG